MTTTLPAFITARLGEWEAAAREPWDTTIESVYLWWDADEDEAAFTAAANGEDVKSLAKTLVQIEHARGTYTRALATVVALRAVVALHRQHAADADSCVTCSAYESTDITGPGYPCPTLRALAAIWADHEGYRAEWSA